MTNEQLSIKKAWRTIGEAFEKMPSERSELETGMTLFGICWALNRLGDANIVSINKTWEMKKIVRRDVDSFGYCFMEFAQYDRKHQLLRASYCYLMAESEG
jgi:hypothetical protein